VTVEITSHSGGDTRAAGRRLAGLLRPGDVLLLNGELGAGKTTFIAGIGEALGIAEPVTSPTFVIVRRYDDGFLPLTHADVYRLGSTGEFDDLDLLETGIDGVIAIEWGEAVAAMIAGDHLKIELLVDEDGDRLIRLHPHGSWAARPLWEVAS
jgi:tRNA threonylcarbamoyladenosine biosynthesis protein TsaE